MLLYFYGLLLVSRASGHIVDCSDFCATYWDLPLVQERLQGEAGMGMGLGFPEYQVCTRFFIVLTWTILSSLFNF